MDTATYVGIASAVIAFFGAFWAVRTPGTDTNRKRVVAANRFIFCFILVSPVDAQVRMQTFQKPRPISG